LSFSRDSRLLVTTSVDHTAIVWQVAEGKEVQLVSQTAVISDAAFSSDSRWLVTAGPSAAGLWEVGKGSSPLFLLRGHSARLTSVAFAPKGWRIVTGSLDGTVREYDCVLCDRLPRLVAIAQAQIRRLSRNLTPAQRNRLLR
jgi:WD40 repeat protein